ncbi:hypothetical protein QL285_086459 [Trifolium repens]|nr:hypothetical protein QL285_086459 [Trifolium repens]
MDLDFDNTLDGLRNAIMNYDLAIMLTRTPFPLKPNMHVLASVLFGKVVQDIEVDFNMTIRKKSIFGCLKAEHAQDFLPAIPIDGLGEHMSPVEHRTILRYRHIILLFSKDEVCDVCRKACLDTFMEHAAHCRELLGFKYSHDLVRDVLFDIFRRAGISVKKEALVNFLTDLQEGRSTLRPANVMMYG